MIEHHYCACGYAAPTAGELLAAYTPANATAANATKHAAASAH